MGRHLAAGALAALLALGAVQPTTQQNLDVDELLRRVDLDGGDLNLDDLLRPAADDTPDAAGAHGASRRAQPSDVPPGRAGVRHEAHASGRAEPTSARTARGEQSAAAHRAPRDERAEEIDAEIDLSDYEPQRGAAMRGFALDDDDDADADAAGRSDDGRARDDDDGEADGATDGEGFSPGGTLSLRIDKTTLAILRRWTNFANGVLLMLLGPITLAISAGSLAFDKMILSIYVSYVHRCKAILPSDARGPTAASARARASPPGAGARGAGSLACSSPLRSCASSPSTRGCAQTFSS